MAKRQITDYYVETACSTFNITTSQNQSLYEIRNRSYFRKKIEEGNKNEAVEGSENLLPI